MTCWKSIASMRPSSDAMRPGRPRPRRTRRRRREKWRSPDRFSANLRAKKKPPNEGGYLRCPTPERFGSLGGDWRRHSSLREGGKLEHSRHTGTIGLYRHVGETRESAESCAHLPFFAILEGGI